MIFRLFFAPLTFLVLFRSYNLLKNYIAARRLNLPLIVLPTSFEDPLWMLVRPLFRWVQHLPSGLGNWYLYTDFGWPMEDGVNTVSRLGETFVLVTPTRNEIITAYPPVADVIYKDIKNWIMPSAFSQVFTHYGQNVSSLNGADWQRHRKITAPAFNDETMRYVWDESIERTIKDLHFLNVGRCTLREMRSDFSVLAMDILATVGFGQDTALTSVPSGHRLSLMESLGFILKNVFIMIIFASLKAPDLILPPMLRQLKLSVAEFKMYMEEAVLRQLKTEKSSKPSLLQAMVTANEAEKQQMSAGKPSYLTDSELYGNLFVFNLAGYDTAAGTMTFALPYLALHPEVQDWVIEEVDRYFTSSTITSYQEVYPKLVRCMAFMYETLRLAGPAAQMVRTPLVPTTIPISLPKDKTDSSTPTSITVPPNTLITAHFHAMHLSPRWGSDVRSFKPQRFITTDAATGREELAMPGDKGLSAIFIPWVMGPRVW